MRAAMAVWIGLRLLPLPGLGHPMMYEHPLASKTFKAQDCPAQPDLTLRLGPAVTAAKKIDPYDQSAKLTKLDRPEAVFLPASQPKKPRAARKKPAPGIPPKTKAMKMKRPVSDLPAHLLTKSGHNRLETVLNPDLRAKSGKTQPTFLLPQYELKRSVRTLSDAVSDANSFKGRNKVFKNLHGSPNSFIPYDFAQSGQAHANMRADENLVNNEHHDIISKQVVYEGESPYTQGIEVVGQNWVDLKQHEFKKMKNTGYNFIGPQFVFPKTATDIINPIFREKMTDDMDMEKRIVNFCGKFERNIEAVLSNGSSTSDDPETQKAIKEYGSAVAKEVREIILSVLIGVQFMSVQGGVKAEKYGVPLKNAWRFLQRYLWSWLELNAGKLQNITRNLTSPAQKHASELLLKRLQYLMARGERGVPQDVIWQFFQMWTESPPVRQRYKEAVDYDWLKDKLDWTRETWKQEQQFRV